VSVFELRSRFRRRSFAAAFSAYRFGFIGVSAGSLPRPQNVSPWCLVNAVSGVYLKKRGCIRFPDFDMPSRDIDHAIQKRI
jgi:hypothetical protein